MLNLSFKLTEEIKFESKMQKMKKTQFFKIWTYYTLEFHWPCNKISGGKLRSDRFLYHEKPKMAKKLPHNSHGWAFYKIVKFALTKKIYQLTIAYTKGYLRYLLK